MQKERIIGIMGGSLGIALKAAILIVLTVYVIKLIPLVFSAVKNGKYSGRFVKDLITFITLIFVLGVIIYGWGVFFFKMYELFNRI